MTILPYNSVMKAFSLASEREEFRADGLKKEQQHRQYGVNASFQRSSSICQTHSKSMCSTAPQGQIRKVRIAREGVMRRRLETVSELCESCRGRDFLIIEYQKSRMTCDSQRHLSINDFKGSICLNLSVTSNCFTFKCLDRFCNSTGTSEAICCRSTALSSGQNTECEGEFDNLSFNYMFFLKHFFHRNAHFSQSTHGCFLLTSALLATGDFFPFSLTRDN